MKKRSEGVKRITLVFSVLSVIVFILGIAIDSDFFSNVPPIGWFIIIVGAIVAYLIPQMIRIVIYWIVDGFRKDKLSPSPKDGKETSK